MITYFGAVVSDSTLKRKNDARRFFEAVQNLYSEDAFLDWLPFICDLRDCIRVGAFSLDDAFACVLAYSRGIVCPELLTLRNFRYYRDAWDIPFSHYANFHFKSFLLWLENLNITKSLSVELDFNPLYNFIDNYVML